MMLCLSHEYLEFSKIKLVVHHHAFWLAELLVGYQWYISSKCEQTERWLLNHVLQDHSSCIQWNQTDYLFLDIAIYCK